MYRCVSVKQPASSEQDTSTVTDSVRLEATPYGSEEGSCLRLIDFCITQL